jgi:Protein of unknown function (DUF1569)
MKSIFDKDTRSEVIARINSLNEASRPQWGKMTVAQMVRHCSLCEEYYYGNVAVKRHFLGRILGKVAIKSILKKGDMGKNAATPPPFKVNEAVPDLEKEKAQWQKLIEQYATFDPKKFTHWFFGEMTKEQIGQFIYIHDNHHLVQFGV